MITCVKCKKDFPIIYKDENGKEHNLCNRKYCLECSPFGKHNNRKIHIIDPNHPYKCRRCGVTDKKLFYRKQYKECAKCHNQDVLKRGQEKRKWAIEQMGGKCSKCGYCKNTCAIEIHHLDPSIKDETFGCMRGWSKERIIKEISTCILLCRNCHAEEHYNKNHNNGA
jgi:hypothetical protein